jgi:molybdopterin molybdotransferase
MPELPDYDTAYELILSQAVTLDAEQVTLQDAAGRVLRGAVAADRDQPPFDRAVMDGFAVRAAAWSPGKRFKIAGQVPAGAALPACLEVDPQREVVRIATGAALPEAFFDAVVQVELGRVEGDEVVFELDELSAGNNLHRRGADAQAGDILIPEGTRLGPQHLGLAAGVGAVRLSVTRRPRVVVLTCGDEVRPPDTPTDRLEPQHIRDANGPLLASMIAALGGEVVDQQHLPDDFELTRQACEQAAARADLVVTAGGVSVGEHDHLPAAWSALGFATVLHGVTMQPGRPVLVGSRVWGSGSGSNPEPQTPDPGPLVLGLPGNPVSVWTTAQLFVAPVLQTMQGDAKGGALPWRRVWLAEPAKANPKREAFRAAGFVGETREQVRVLPWQGSGDLAHTAAAEGLVRLPLTAEPVPPGTALSMLPVVGSGVGG